MHMYKYMPQFELSQNSMFKNIVNFKLLLVYIFQYGVRLVVMGIGWKFIIDHQFNASDRLSNIIKIGSYKP